LRELAICPNAWLVRLVVAASDDAVGLLTNFTGAEEEAACLFRPEGTAFSPWRSQ